MLTYFNRIKEQFLNKTLRCTGKPSKTMIKGFIKSELVHEVLEVGRQTNQNVVLYGPGGYGKSEMSLAYLKEHYKEKDIAVKALSVGTTVDDLLGGINIKTLKDTGEVIYNVDKSIFASKVLILEEAFDAPVRVLEGLKDILTSRKVRNGSQQWSIKTEFIIVCTNRSKDELTTDASSRALMERFPLSLHVTWNTHSLSDYKELCLTVFNKENPDFTALMSYMLESIAEDESKRPPVPRTAVRMFKVLDQFGKEGLKYMDGLPNINRALEYISEYRVIQERKEEFVKRMKKSIETGQQLVQLNPTLSEIKAFNLKLRELRESYTEEEREGIDPCNYKISI